VLRVSLRNLLGHKVRLVLSALAIVLGVAFVAGSFVFTDTMGRSFDNIIEGSTPDAVVRPKGQDNWDVNSLLIDTRTIEADVVRELRTVPGAARVDGSVGSQTLFVVGSDGKIVGGTGAPTLSFNYTETPAMTGTPTVRVTHGNAPARFDEVVLDEKSADRAGYRLGDEVHMVTAGDQAALTARLVGIARFGGGGLAGATLVLFDTRTAQRLFLDGRDSYNSVNLTAAPGVSQKTLADRAGSILPQGLEAVTGDQVAKETQDAIAHELSFVTIFLLVFAGIALVVGSFLIINTFSILVAQRSRELAVLRALGASRRQVTVSVLVEAAVLGVVSGTLGLLGGWGLAVALRAVFASLGLDLSATPLVFAPRTVLVGYVVGVVVTAFAAYLPARRAARIAPVAAMYDEVALPETSIRRRTVVGGVLGLTGAGLLALGLADLVGNAPGLIGAGVLAILMGVTLAGPVVDRPLLALLGRGYRVAFGAIGTLAGENVRRNPRRTAATASALMIGLTLVTTMSVLGASVNASIDKTVDEQFSTDYLLSNPIGLSFSPSIAQQARQLEGVGPVAEMQRVPAEVDGSSDMVTVADAVEVAAIFDLRPIAGVITPGTSEVAVSKSYGRRHDVGVDDTLVLGFPTGPRRVRVVGVFEDSQVVTGIVAPFSLVREARLPRFDNAVAVDAVDGASVAALGRQLDRLVRDVPTVNVQTKEEFSQTQRASVDQLLYLIYALLALAIIIAVLGIVNTLALSVIERTREVGLLRAVGVSRRQLRRMVRLEAMAIAVVGACFGVALGIVFGAALQRSVADQGVEVLAVPVVRLAVLIVVAGFVGVLAAALPARRAARLNVLRAISTA
jgi:putative ABC transport system permease protein